MLGSDQADPTLISTTMKVGGSRHAMPPTTSVPVSVGTDVMKCYIGHEVEKLVRRSKVQEEEYQAVSFV